MTVKKKVVVEKSLPEVSAKCTKDQILSAYNEVLEMLMAQKIQSPLEEKMKNEETQIVAKSTKTTAENIVSHLANLKINLTKQIDILSEKLKSQYNFEMMLKDKEVEGDKKILIQNIKSLESKGKEQEIFSKSAGKDRVK